VGFCLGGSLVNHTVVHLLISVGERSAQIFGPFCLFVIELSSLFSLYVFPIRYMTHKCFLPFSEFSFHSFGEVFGSTKVLHLDEAQSQMACSFCRSARNSSFSVRVFVCLWLIGWACRLRGS
jgi:hypothetical protein